MVKRPSVAAKVSRWHSRRKTSFRRAKTCVSHGCSAHVIFAGITWYMIRARFTAFHTGFEICARYPSDDNMNEMISASVWLQVLVQEFDYLAHHCVVNPSGFASPQNGSRVQMHSQCGGRLNTTQMLYIHQQDLRNNVLDHFIVANKGHQRKHPTSLGCRCIGHQGAS